MTGGCHYAWDCIGYVDGCINCPAVGIIHQNLPSKTLQYKKKMIENIGIEPISGTAWLTMQLKKSLLFKDTKIHEIMLGIDTEIFKPLNEDDILSIKLKYDLPPDKKIIFFGASSTTEERKGFDYLIKALELISQNSSIESSSVIIVTAGKVISEDIFKNIRLPHRHISYLNGDTELAQAYQIATVFVSPSIEDSGPMMINESIMCGTPVVSFKMGVAEDLVFNGETGYVAELKNIDDLSNGIRKIINLEYKEYKKMQENCRKIGLEKCSIEVQMKKLTSLIGEK